MAELHIELAKPTAEQNNHHWDQKKKCYVGERFDPGERIIMVDGVRWGRTEITHHGPRGVSYTFYQQNGSEVTTGKVWRSGDPEVVKVYDKEKVLPKVRELIEQGLLRDPQIVAQENEKHRQQFVAARDARQAEQDKAFRERAWEAVGFCGTAEVVDRVVAAMKWAQTQ